MNIEEYIAKRKEIQDCLLKMIDDVENVEEHYQSVISLMQNQEIEKDPHEIKSFLYLISNIINNHFRSTDFFVKIEKILITMKYNIKENMLNDEIFQLFKNNKRILLFLIKEKIMYIDEKIKEYFKQNIYQKSNYTQYLSNILNKISDENDDTKTQEQELKDFETKQLKGENDNYICHLIRNDLIDEFKAYINDSKIEFNAIIEQSIYETNTFLINKNISLIEYASFFGSYNIFKFLFENNAKIDPTIWIFIIYGKNHQIMKFLEDQHLEPNEQIYNECLQESIKCHHNDITTYIEKKINDKDKNSNIIEWSIEYYNYTYFPVNFDHNIIRNLIEYDYYPIISLLLKDKKINLDDAIEYSLTNKKYDIANLLNQQKDFNNNIINYIKNADEINETSKIRVNINLTGNIIQIESASFKYNPINDCYVLGLNEAFSTSTNDQDFMKSIIPFKEIVESNFSDNCQNISEMIKDKIKDNENDDTNSIQQTRNELINLISLLFPNATIEDITRSIDECGGMINYIIPLMHQKHLLKPKEKTIEINDYFITAGIMLFFHETIKSDLIKSTPFSFWRQNKEGSIELTRIAKNRLSASKHPALILLFGSLRTGKSTTASYLYRGKKNILNTAFKTAGSSKSCTQFIDAIGPIKCKDFAESYNMLDEIYNNPNSDRDIFIIDSEGLNSIFKETSWLKTALLSMLPINTISLYVAKSTNKSDLDQFMKYLRLVRVIGGIEIHHGLGYINNFEVFDGLNVIDELKKQNNTLTQEMIDEFSKTSIMIDDSHFKCLSVLSFDRHKKEYYFSLSEIAHFIIDICLNEKTLFTGDMLIDMLEQLSEKVNGITDFNDSDKMFEIIFLQVIEKAMKCSIEEQIPSISKDIFHNLTLMRSQDLNLLDLNEYIKDIEEKGYLNQILDKAILKTLPEIPQSFPVIMETAYSTAIDILKNIIIKERLKIIDKEAIEVPDLGCGFSFADGTFKKRIFDLKFNKLAEKKLGNNVFVVFHLPEFAELDIVPINYQKHYSKMHSSFDNYLSNISSKFCDSDLSSIISSRFSFYKTKKFAQNIMGLSFSSKSPETEIDVSINVKSIAQVQFNKDVDLKNYLSQDLNKKLIELDKILTKFDIKDDKVKHIVSKIYSEYGEFVSIGFFVGNYNIEIQHRDQFDIQTAGQAAFSSFKNNSNGINLIGLKLNKSKNEENQEIKSINSQVISKIDDQICISYGNESQPTTFMFDIVENSRYGSSFVPLSQFANSQRTANALDYWSKRWNLQPQTLPEYMYFHDTDIIPKCQKIYLYTKGRPYEVYINKDGEIEIPGSLIEYPHYRNYNHHLTNDGFETAVILDPSKMSISRFIENAFSKVWKDNVARKTRYFGYEGRSIHIKLGPLWEFDQEITPAYFTGNGLFLLDLHVIDSHSFDINMNGAPHKSGKSWTSGPYSVNLKQNLRVKLV